MEVAQGDAPWAATGRSPWRNALARLARNRTAAASAVVVAVVVAAVTVGASAASALLGHGPNDPFPYAVDSSLRPAGPWTTVPALQSAVYSDDPDDLELAAPPPGTEGTTLVLGADGPLGRDLFLRILYGGRVSLVVAVGGALLAVLLGATLGAAAAYFGGWLDWAVARLTELTMAFPILLLIILLGAAGSPIDDVTLGGILEPGVLSLTVLIGLFTWFYPARIVRAQVLALRRSEFVEAAEMVGAGGWRIIRTHLRPHVVPELLAYGTLMIATNITLEAGISFLGAGIELPTPSWGTLLSAAWGTALAPGATTPVVQPWVTAFPCLVIFVTVLAFNQLGEALAEALGLRGVVR